MSVTSLLIDLLRTPSRVRDEDLGVIDPSTLVRAAEAEQVTPLAAAVLSSARPGSPHAAAMHRAAAEWTLREAAERDAIRALLDRAGDLPWLFFKGASMAYGVYAIPALRMREDWDLVVAPGAWRNAEAAILAAGFTVDRGIKPGRIRMRQRSYRKDVAGGQCIVDLHERVLNPPSLADRVPYGALDAHAMPLPRLHPLARGVAAAPSLVLACMHRLAHHSAESRLAWDYDVALLLQRMNGSREARATAGVAAACGGEAFVRAEVSRVMARFGIPPAAHITELLDALAPADVAYAEPNRSQAREFALDWRVLGWRDRAALVRETVFPNAAFLRASTGSRLPLPWLYMRRIAKGARGWFRTGRGRRAPRE